MCRYRADPIRHSVLVNPDLSAAVTTYIWPGTTRHPTTSTNAVVDRFGSDAAVDLVPLIMSLQEELGQSEWLHGSRSPTPQPAWGRTSPPPTLN